MSDVGRRIRQIRTNKRMQLRETARRIGIPHNSLYRYERGMNDPSASMLEKIAKGLGVSVAELFTEEGDAGENPLVESTYTSDDLAETFAADVRRFAERARADFKWQQTSAPNSIPELEMIMKLHDSAYHAFFDEAEGEAGYPPTYRDKPDVFDALAEYGDVVGAIKAAYNAMPDDPRKRVRGIGEKKDTA